MTCDPNEIHRMNQMRKIMEKYQIEFPDFDSSTMPAIPADWTDISWRKDCCPKFAVGDSGVEVFIDFLDTKDREYGDEAERFCVYRNQDDPEANGGGELDFSSDDWDATLAYVARVTGKAESHA